MEQKKKKELKFEDICAIVGLFVILGLYLMGFILVIFQEIISCLN